MEDRELKLTLKSWVRNLLAIWQFLTNNKLVPSPQFLWQIGSEGLFREIELTREIVKSISPDPVVYYPGIGNIGIAGLDIIYALLVTDFSKLIAVDTGPYKAASNNYERFIQAVTLNLALVSAVKQEKIGFQKISDNEFRANFLLGEGDRPRELHFFSNFDATSRYPSELKDGFQVFFTRRTNDLFCCDIKNSVPRPLRKEFMSFLANGGLAIFQEFVSRDESGLGLRENISERKLWLGDDFEFVPLGLKTKSWERLMCFRKKAGN